MNKSTRNEEAKAHAFKRLLIIMDELRVACPWDKKQTNESLHYLTIEETYELADAILQGDAESIKEEVGDLFLHLVFYSKIGEEKNQFDVADVLHAVCDKLVERHPHIYGDLEVTDEEEVKANWEKIKLKSGKSKGVLGGVPRGLPALVKAQRIQEKAHGVGFDWSAREAVWDKVLEEIQELQEEVAREPIQHDQLTAEFGDVLFSLINYARFIGVNPEEALERTNQKFMRRFQHMEQAMQTERKTFDQLSLSEMDAYWNNAKKN